MPNNSAGGAAIGVVVIGRNEGKRLQVCLESVVYNNAITVYVDSGSTDDSVKMARGKGAVVVELDMALPFTAARARNEGFRALCDQEPALKYVQFVDGDCEVVDSWIKTGFDFLVKNERVAVVCGRRQERFPEHSVYNMLCDIEWNTPVGEAKACGGDSMMSVAALKQVGGFKEDLIAGEEPELCVRLRQQGWAIWRLEADMTLHDAAMLKFSQWWKRSVRGGHAFAQGACLHGALPERHSVREARSAWIWGLAIPLAVTLSTFFLGLAGLALLVIYPLQILRLTIKGKHDVSVNFLRAFFLVLGKFPEMVGAFRFHLGKFTRSETRLIEYK